MIFLPIYDVYSDDDSNVNYGSNGESNDTYDVCTEKSKVELEKNIIVAIQQKEYIGLWYVDPFWLCTW